MSSAIKTTAGRPHRGLIEVAGLVGLYFLYELLRGMGGVNFPLALAHTANIVDLERALGVFHERDVQEWANALPFLPFLLGTAYMSLHGLVTVGVMRWVYRRRPDAFPLVRTTLVGATAIALFVYVMYPAAPPRLAGLGFADTVTSGAHLNLSSDFLGSFYNPLAAVPSLHFGYALLSGAALAVLADRRWVRVFGALYPALMLFVIVATGNHFLFDAAAGGGVVVGAWWIARRLVQDAPTRARLRPATA